MIKLKNLHKSYKMGSSSLHVLKGINLNIEDGELVAIMGSSGSGKSTLLNILGMLDTADKGDYILDSFKIENLTAIILSFLFSLLTIKYFLKFISKFSLKIFVLYRILLGLLLLILTYL